MRGSVRRLEPRSLPATRSHGSGTRPILLRAGEPLQHADVSLPSRRAEDPRAYRRHEPQLWPALPARRILAGSDGLPRLLATPALPQAVVVAQRLGHRQHPDARRARANCLSQLSRSSWRASRSRSANQPSIPQRIWLRNAAAAGRLRKLAGLGRRLRLHLPARVDRARSWVATSSRATSTWPTK